MKKTLQLIKHNIYLVFILAGFLAIAPISHAALNAKVLNPREAIAQADPAPVTTTTDPTHSTTPTPTDTTTPVHSSTPAPTTTAVTTTVATTTPDPTTTAVTTTVVPTSVDVSTTAIPGLITQTQAPTTAPVANQNSSNNSPIVPTTTTDIYNNIPTNVTELPKEDKTNPAVLSSYLTNLNDVTSEYTYSSSKISKEDAAKYYAVSGALVGLGTLMIFSNNIYLLFRKTFLRNNYI